MPQMSVRYGPLLQLELKRCLHLAVPVILILVCILTGQQDWAPELLEVDEPEGGTTSRAMKRQGIWSLALLWVLLISTLSAARVLPGWKKGEWQWIGSGATRPMRLILAAWAAHALGAAILCLSTLVLVEMQVESRSTSRQLLQSYELPASIRLEPGESWAFKIQAAPVAEQPGSISLVVRPSYGADPTTAAELRVEHGTESTTSRARIAAATELETVLPDRARSPMTVRLSNKGTGILTLDRTGGIRHWDAPGPEWRGSLAMALHGLIGLALLCALSQGLSGWMGVGSSTGLALTLALGSVLAPQSLQSWFPCSGLVQSLEWLGEGRTPGFPAASDLVPACMGILAGLLLARAAVASGRLSQ